MYAPVCRVMLKQPHNNAFLKGSFYNLLDVSLIKKHIYLLGFFFPWSRDNNLPTEQNIGTLTTKMKFLIPPQV